MRFIIMLILLMNSSMSYAINSFQYSFISNPDTVDVNLDQKDLQDIFTFKRAYWYTGVPIVVVLYDKDSTLNRSMFRYFRITSTRARSLMRVRDIRGRPRVIFVKSQLEAINIVQKTVGAIGFIITVPKPIDTQSNEADDD